MAWQTIQEAARRLGCNPGHLRKVCHDKWGPAGIARQERNGKTRARWMIRSDAELDAKRGRPLAAKSDPAKVLSVDQLHTLLRNYDVNVQDLAGLIDNMLAETELPEVTRLLLQGIVLQLESFSDLFRSSLIIESETAIGMYDDKIAWPVEFRWPSNHSVRRDREKAEAITRASKPV